LARALDAAPSLGDAIEASINACDDPLREELVVVVGEMHLGHSVLQVLGHWEQRVRSRTLSMAIMTLQLGRETGGPLSDLLKNAAASLREMDRLEGLVRSKTAEGRAQAWVISAVPIPLYFAVTMGDPRYFLALETTPLGQLLLALAVGLWICAGLSARSILAVRI
jgi:tight adherence protein B